MATFYKFKTIYKFEKTTIETDKNCISEDQEFPVFKKERVSCRTTENGADAEIAR